MKKILSLALIAFSLSSQAQTIDSLNKAPIQPVLLYDAIGNVVDTATQLYVYPQVTVSNGTVTITAVLQNKDGGGVAQPINYTSTTSEYDAWNDEAYLFQLANKRIYGNKLKFQ